MKSPKNYQDKLADPRWQKRRLKVLEYARWRCQICGNDKEELHCHHSYYERGKQPWQYPDGAIICVCHTCHGKLHPKKPNYEPERALSPIDPGTVPCRFTQMKALLDKLP